MSTKTFYLCPGGESDEQITKLLKAMEIARESKEPIMLITGDLPDSVTEISEQGIIRLSLAEFVRKIYFNHATKG